MVQLKSRPQPDKKCCGGALRELCINLKELNQHCKILSYTFYTQNQYQFKGMY